MATPALAVLVVGAGLAWEPAALAALDRTAGLVMLRRCMDVTDLLAHAAAGDAHVAVLAAEAPGLDADATARLRRDGVEPLVVVSGEVSLASERLRRAGVRHAVGADQMGGLAAAVRAAAAEGDASAAVPHSSSGAVRLPVVAGGGGVTVAVWGPAGAPGRTTVALGMAAELAARGSDPLLIDADPWGGVVAQRLAVLDEVSGLLAATRSVTRGATGEELLGAAAKRAGGFRIVTGLPRADRWQEAGVDALVALADASGGPCILDTGASLEDDAAADFAGRPGRNGLTLTALEIADVVVVVGTPDPVGLARLARGLDDLRDRVAAQQVHVVLNRWRARLGIDVAEARRLLREFAGAATFHVLPDDALAADRSLVTGRTLQEAGPSPLSRAFTPLVDAVFPGSGPSDGAPRGAIRRRRAGAVRRR